MPRCIHRATAPRRMIACTTCPGNIRAKVFACAVHGECTLQPHAEIGPSCRECPDHVPHDSTAAAKERRAVVLRCDLPPGDLVVLSGAIDALHARHPGAFATAVECLHPAIFDHHPHVVPRNQLGDDAETFRVHYSGGGREATIDLCNQRPIHFLEAWCEGLGHAIGLGSAETLRPIANAPRLYLSQEERGWVSQVQESTGRPTRYWIVNAGRKSDYTAKQWPASSFQEVVDRTQGRIRWVQIGAADESHHHPELSGVIDLRGKTDLRQLIRLVHHAEGVLTGVSLPMHLAAAVPRTAAWGDWPRPAIVVAGGREPQAWNTYPGQHYLHAIGALDCCMAGGCWKSRTVPLDDGDAKDADLCAHPDEGPDGVYPRCHRLITPDLVCSIMERYL